MAGVLDGYGEFFDNMFADTDSEDEGFEGYDSGEEEEEVEPIQGCQVDTMKMREICKRSGS